MAMAMDEPVATPGGAGEGPAGLLLSRDLIFTSKIMGTAQALGHRVTTAGNMALATTLIEQGHPRVVFVDLGAGDLVSPAALASYRKAAGPATRFLAFGSHVDTQALAAAAAAGCDPVLPRSRFSAQLPDLIRLYLGKPETSVG